MDAHLLSDPPPAAHLRWRWLTFDRLNAYAGLVALMVEAVYLTMAMIVSCRRYGQPLGFDFSTFWAAGRLALDGKPLLAYSEHALDQLFATVLPHAFPPGAWFYPPIFLVMVKPLALMSPLIAYPLFAFGTGGAFLAMLRRLLPVTGAMVWILAFPGFWLNLVQGQNGALTGCLALGALLLLKGGKPVRAGICIGLLSMKPQLAILFPFALAAAGMWRAFAAAAVTTVVLAAGSVAMLGWPVVPVFLHSVALANHRVATGSLPWFQMASVFASLRSLQVPVGAAYAVHATVAAAALALVCWVWRATQDMDLRACALVVGTFLISPYIYNYDAIWLGIPIALLARLGLREGWLRGERVVLAIAFVYPALGNAYARGWGPVVFGLLLYVILRRVWNRMTKDVVSNSTQPDASKTFSRVTG